MAAYGTIFLLILIGRLCAGFKWMPESAAERINRAVILFCLPAVIFIHVPTLELSSDLLPLVLTPWLLLFVSIGFVFLLSYWLRFSKPVTAVLLVLVPLGNTSFLGFPLISALLGDDALSYAVVYDQFGSFLILCTHALFVTAWYSEHLKVSASTILKRIATFPPFVALILALLIGNAWFPGWLMSLAEGLAWLLLPLVTLAIGLQLRLRLVTEYRLPLILGLVGKLILLPALALALSLAWTMPNEIQAVNVLESAMPPMITAAALLSGARLAPPLASAMVAWGVLFSVASVPFWHWLLIVLNA